MKRTSYIVAGPTASGKSEFAHALARAVDGVVINCDSVQIYRGIENISASPFAGIIGAEHVPPLQIDGIPYRLFSILPLTEQISVAGYLELARTEYSAAISSGKPAIFVGGTGFYINALIHGLSPIPEISKQNRARAREIVKNAPENAMELLNLKPQTSNLKLDPQRLARALEVFLETGRPLSEWQALPRRGAVIPDATKILINPHKDILAARIAKRIPEMLANGALDEARAIIAANWPDERAIGASELVKFIHGETDEKTMLENWSLRTNQYAKRQRTWFRTQFAADLEIPHVPTEKDIIPLLRRGVAEGDGEGYPE